MSKPRVLKEQCSDCIGRPGNMMDLRPGRVREMVNGSLRDGGGIVCHQTLSYGAHKELGEAYCRWFYDKFGHLSNYFRICHRLGGFDEVEIPPDAPESV